MNPELKLQGGTTHFTNFNINGAASNLVIVKAASGVTNFVHDDAGVVAANYLNLQNVHATPALATWYAAASTDGGGNTGWIWGTPPITSKKKTRSIGGGLSPSSPEYL